MNVGDKVYGVRMVFEQQAVPPYVPPLEFTEQWNKLNESPDWEEEDDEPETEWVFKRFAFKTFTITEINDQLIRFVDTRGKQWERLHPTRIEGSGKLPGEDGVDGIAIQTRFFHPIIAVDPTQHEYPDYMDMFTHNWAMDRNLRKLQQGNLFGWNSWDEVDELQKHRKLLWDGFAKHAHIRPKRVFKKLPKGHLDKLFDKNGCWDSAINP